MKVTFECYTNRDAQDYLAGCEHPEHSLVKCNNGACQGYIVEWEGFEQPVVCATCRDAGFSDETPRAVHPLITEFIRRLVFPASEVPDALSPKDKVALQAANITIERKVDVLTDKVTYSVENEGRVVEDAIKQRWLADEAALAEMGFRFDFQGNLMMKRKKRTPIPQEPQHG